MSSSEPENLRIRTLPSSRGWILTGLLAAWGLGVLVLFALTSRALVEPLGGLVTKALWALASTWAAGFGGWRLRRALSSASNRVALDPLEETAYELGAGLAVMAGALFAIGAAGLYSFGSACLLLIVLSLGDPRPWLRDLVARVRAAGAPSRFCGIALACVGVMTLLESFAPATSQDALVYHLAVPSLYIRAGGIEYVPGNFFANFPQNIEMLFTLGLLLDGSALAKFYHWLLGVCATLAVAALARRVSASGRGGSVAALAFATIPTAALIATWAYVDLGLVFFQVLALLAFLRWWEDPVSLRFFAASATFCGLAAGCKYTGGAIGLVLGLALFAESALRKRSLARALGKFAAFGGVALLVASPWYVKNAVLTGNPLHPFLHGIFGGRDWDGERAAVLSSFLGEWGAGDGLVELLLLPFRLTFSARFFSIEGFDGVIGAAFLVGAPLLAFSCRREPRSIVTLGVFVALALFWVLMTRQIRFLLPALALGAALIGAGSVSITQGPLRRVFAFSLGGAFLFNTLVISTHFAAHNPVPVVFGFESEDDWLEREIVGGDYEVFRHINRNLPEDARVLFAACGNPVFLCERDYRMEAIFENRLLLEVLRGARDPAAVRDEMRRRGYTHLLFRLSLVFDAGGKRTDLSLEEQLLFQGFLNRHARLACAREDTLLYELLDEDPSPDRDASPGEGAP